VPFIAFHETEKLEKITKHIKQNNTNISRSQMSQLALNQTFRVEKNIWNPLCLMARTHRPDNCN